MIGGQQDNLLLILQIAVQMNTRAGSVATDKKCLDIEDDATIAYIPILSELITYFDL